MCNEHVDKKKDIWNDWKIVTIFVGINDVCSSSCQDYNTSLWNVNIVNALDYLMENLPRTFVNLVQLMKIGNLMKNTLKNSNGYQCSKLSCVCTGLGNTSTNLESFNQNYQVSRDWFNFSTKYDDLDNFTVVLQPFFNDVAFENYLDPYKSCIHLGPADHRDLPLGLWNNMFEKVGNKSRNLRFPITEITCPTDQWPYLFTARNSGWRAKIFLVNSSKSGPLNVIVLHNLYAH